MISYGYNGDNGFFNILLDQHADSFPLASAELYDPLLGISSSTGGLNVARLGHTATPLPSGKVLVVGGYDGHGTVLSSAELYDPSTGAFSNTGPLNTGRYRHTATPLPLGKVLIAGGQGLDASGDPVPLSSAEVYDPASGTFSNTGSLNVARTNHEAVLLADGNVLVAGGLGPDGYPLDSAELYIASSPSPPPVILNVAKLGSPFRITVQGNNLQAGIKVFIGSVPWSNAVWKNASKLVIKGGAGLKTLIPKGQVTPLRFLNPDGGEAVYNFLW